MTTHQVNTRQSIKKRKLGNSRLKASTIYSLEFFQSLIHKIPFLTKIKTLKDNKYLRLIKYIGLAVIIISEILEATDVLPASSEKISRPLYIIILWGTVKIFTKVFKEKIKGFVYGFFKKITIGLGCMGMTYSYTLLPDSKDNETKKIRKRGRSNEKDSAINIYNQ